MGKGKAISTSAPNDHELTWSQASPYTWPKRLRHVATITEEDLHRHTTAGQAVLTARIAELRAEADQFEAEHPAVGDVPVRDYARYFRGLE